MKTLKKSLLTLFAIIAMVVICCFGVSALRETGKCGDNVYWNYDSSTKELVISGTGAMVDQFAYNGSPFYDSDIKSVVINSGVTTICSSAFRDCTNLTSITIPDSVTSIGVGAFKNTAYYNSDVNWKNNVLYIGKHLIVAKASVSGDYNIKDGTLTIADSAFYYCDNLTSVEIPDSVIAIGSSAFEFCYSLQSVIIPNSVITIGASAFSFCESFTSVVIPDSVTTIGTSAFDNCESLMIITVDKNNKNYCNDDYGVLFNKKKTELIHYPIGNTRTAYKIPDSVTTIGEYAFEGCTSLQNITIPDNVTTIGNYVFFGCYSLTSVTIPASVTTIGRSAFYHCTRLQSITVDKNNKNYCNDDYGVLFNKNKTELIQYPIGNTRTEYIIPDCVTAIGTDAFGWCHSLKSIKIPDSVTTIGSSAFASCDITSVTIGNGVTTIEYGAFSSCDSLKDVYYYGTEDQWKKISIGSYNECLNGANIHYNYKNDEDFISELKYGTDRLSFGEDITGYVGDTIDTIVVYTTKDENIASLDITSSNTDVVEIGTIEIGNGDYITLENECKAIIPLKLKQEGISTITIISPEGVSVSILVAVHPKATESEDINQYTKEHISFVSSNKYSNLTTNASFYNSIWCHEEVSRNFTRYAAWDVIGRVGKFASLDFYGAFKTENPYDVILVDLFRSYVNNEKSKVEKAFETSAKNILGSPNALNDVLDVLKTSDAWNSELTKSWLEFTKDIQSKWLKGVFFEESTFNMDDYYPELYKVLKDVFKTNKSGIEKTFKNIKNLETITDYITSGGDIVYRYFDARQKYLLAEALFETNKYVLSSVEMIAKFQMTGENSELLLDALDPYWDVCDYDSAFSSVCDIMFEDGLLDSTGNVVYTLLGKRLLKDFVNYAIHTATGLPYNVLVATYNLTYMCLDYLSGLGKLSETHTLMNAAALFEKEYIKLVKGKGEALVTNKTYQAAAEFDTTWGFLQTLEGFCYKTMSEYLSAFKREYKTNYVIDIAITNNPIFAIINGIKLSENLSSCNSAIKSVLYLESEWANANCHEGVWNQEEFLNCYYSQHSMETFQQQNPVCGKSGYSAGVYCNECKKWILGHSKITYEGHKYEKITTPATLTANGKTEYKCTCGDVQKTETIAKVKSLSLSTTKYIYDGKNKTPKVTIKDSEGKVLTKNVDYKLVVASKRAGIGRYTVKVTFIGNYSGTKNLYFYIIPGKPATVKSSSQGPTSNKLTWSEVPGAVGYTLYYYSNSKKAYVKINTTTNTTYTVKGLLTGTKYTFKIVAYGETTSGKVYDSETYVLLKSATKTKTPELTKVTASSTKGKAYVYHTDVKGETGYTVYYSTSSTTGFKKYANFKADTTRCDITKLTSGKTYYFKVRTYIKTDSGYVYSPWSAVKGVKIK